MIKPNLLNITLCIFAKYLIFYFILMFKSNDFYLLNPGIRDGNDLFYYLWMFMSLPIIISILFATPLYYIFKTKKAAYIICSIILFLVIEYFLYTFLESQLDKWNGIYSGIIGISLFLVYFYKSIFVKIKI